MVTLFKKKAFRAPLSLLLNDTKHAEFSMNGEINSTLDKDNVQQQHNNGCIHIILQLQQ